MTDYDFLLVGHGIAGAMLAESFRARGQRVLVYDRPNPNSASNVAAGLMNPVAGKRFALSWMAAELLPAATAAYRALNTRFNHQFFVATPIFKAFGSVQEQQQMLARRAENVWGDFVKTITDCDPELPGVTAPLGGVWLQHGGHVAVAALLAALASEAQNTDGLRLEPFDWAALTVQADGRLNYANAVLARHVVCCEGAAAKQNPYFNWLPLTPNQGEVLDVDCPGLSQAQVLNRAAYVVPVGAGQFRVGATYRWPPFAEGTTNEALTELSNRLAGLTPLPFAVRGQRAGVRPAVYDRRPLLGRHPAHPWLSFCGGYGSKGVMLAPRLAELLAEHLLHDAPLWPEADLARCVEKFYVR